MNKKDPSTSLLGIALIIIGIGGLLALPFIALLFWMTSYSKAPSALNFIVIASLGVPCVFYILAVTRRWAKSRLLSIGIPLHVVWWPFLTFASADSLEGLVLFSVTVAVFVLFLTYSLRFKSGPV